ncbi:hypothetical protein M8C21_028003, partial [Ambrosia artemisiifolia]
MLDRWIDDTYPQAFNVIFEGAAHVNVSHIVPTEYKYISKEVLPTNQFSVTEYFSPMNEHDRRWPVVYFLYDLSSITVTIKEERRRSFLHFITRLCAVLGGTFALIGALRPVPFVSFFSNILCVFGCSPGSTEATTLREVQTISRPSRSLSSITRAVSRDGGFNIFLFFNYATELLHLLAISEYNKFKSKILHNYASADGFTIIFIKARDEKNNAGMKDV